MHPMKHPLVQFSSVLCKARVISASALGAIYILQSRSHIYLRHRVFQVGIQHGASLHCDCHQHRSGGSLARQSWARECCRNHWPSCRCSIRHDTHFVEVASRWQSYLQELYVSQSLSADMAKGARRDEGQPLPAGKQPVLAFSCQACSRQARCCTISRFSCGVRGRLT